MIAAFADLEIRVVLRRELDALRRDEIGERIVRPRQVRVHGGHHLGGRVRSGDREHVRMRVADERAAVLGAEAAGDDHLAVFGERFADRVERFGDGGVDEAAGVDDDEIGAFVGRRDRVALGAQLRDDLLGIDERLRAAERNEADARRARFGALGAACGAARSLPAWSWGEGVGSRESGVRARALRCGDPGVDASGAGRNFAAQNNPALQRGCCGASGRQRFFSSSGADCCAALKLGNGNAAKMPRVWSCIRCCMSMNSFALCSR